MEHFGIFNDESADWTEAESVEAGFYSREEAEAAIAERYDADDDLTVHLIEEPEDDDDVDDEDREEFDEEEGDGDVD